VLAIKDAGTDREVLKARFVVPGHRDRLKSSILHDTSTVRYHSIRILVGLAAVFGFNLFSSDVIQAYPQSAELLDRKIYVKPTAEFELAPDQLLQLLKPLYGLSESGDYWGRTFRFHLEQELGMQATTGDAALFFRKIGEKLEGL